jgi:AcrR family transcriptional regulator
MSNNRQQLIEVAADLFHRQGYDATGLEQLLAITGVARSNFYYHFKSKGELAVEVVRHWTRLYDDGLMKPTLGNPSLSPREQLHQLFERAAASQDPATARTGCPLGRLSVDLAGREPAVQRVLDEYFASLREQIASSLDMPPLGQKLSASQVQRLADLALCALEGSLLMSHLRSDPESVRRAGVALVNLIDDLTHGS